MSEQEPAGDGDRRGRGRLRGARARVGRGAAGRTAPPASSAPMRHSAAHVMAEAVLDLFPGTKLGIGPAIDDGFYYDFQLPRPLTPDDLAGDRGADARERSPPTTRSSCQRADAGRGAGVPRRARPAVQGRDPRRPRWPRRSATARRCRRRRSTSRARSSTCAAARTSRAPARSARSSCSARRRRVLARRREAPDAPAHLRHGLGDPGGARRSTCGGARRRRSATTAGSASQLDLFSFHDVSPGLGLLAPEGPAASGGRSRARCASSRRGAATRRSARRSSSSSGCGSSPGHWDHYDENMFIVESENQLFSLKPMNCPESTFIYRSQAALVPRPAAALQRVRPAPPQRALRHAVAG